MKAHEGEARRVNRLLDRSRKVSVFEALQDFVRAFIDVRRRGLPAPFLRGLLFGHDDLRLLLRDGVKVSRSDARVGLAVIVVVVV